MRRITLGEYPALGLSAAREAADKRRAQRNDGVDPRAQRDRERAEHAQADVTFGELCDLYIEHVMERGKLSWQTDYDISSAALCRARNRARVKTKRKSSVQKPNSASGRPRR
jgi:hypothetical protein